jgi:transcriptional regulator with XRE-family HTH domain
LARQASGALIKETREKLDVKLLELAHAVGISTTDLQAIEKGDRQPTGDEVVKIADWFEVNPEKFYSEADDNRYRGNKGRVGKPITTGDFSRPHDQLEKERELAVLRHWAQNSSMQEVHAHWPKIDRLAELERELVGRSTISDAVREAFGAPEPPRSSSAADLRRQQSERQRREYAEAGGGVPPNSWRVE